MNSHLLVVLPALPVALHALAAFTALRGDRENAWRRAEAAALGAMLAGATAVAAVLALGPASTAGLRLDAPGAIVAMLVGFIGWVIVRFSKRYLHGEPDERRYLRLLSATLAAVALVLVADHLLLLALAWCLTSATLHPLLRFYPTRAAARLAAHKKFVSARVADVALLGAVALMGGAYGTFSLGELLERAASEGVPPVAQAGLLLLVLTALLKCAQLPMHGWLIQVMEAPTPVSALLHAGVVNLGGLVLIRFAPLLAQAPWALGLLAAAATFTVVLATLVVGTRVSIKVALAWSTVAQMGFMLLQVALGLPAMALLHLVAHSLYKAHAFLAAGGVVQRRQALRLAPAAVPAGWRWAVAALLLPPAVLGIGVAAGALTTPAAGLAAVVLGGALVPLAAAGRVMATLGVVLGWFLGHALTSVWLVPADFVVPAVLPWLVGLAFGLLFALQAAIVLRPASPAVRWLYPWAYGGFYLDELVSRVLLRRWPMPDTLAGAPR
jgi:NAD(P)H-quinone oxidoreductase subunit 5